MKIQNILRDSARILTSKKKKIEKRPKNNFEKGFPKKKEPRKMYPRRFTINKSMKKVSKSRKNPSERCRNISNSFKIHPMLHFPFFSCEGLSSSFY